MSNEIKKNFFKQARFEEINMKEIEAKKFQVGDIFENKNLETYVVQKVFEAENKLYVGYFPKEKGMPNTFTVNFNFEEDKEKAQLIFRSSNQKVAENYFENADYHLMTFNFEDINNYKIFDIIVKNNNAIWFVNKIDKEENTMQLIKFPVESGEKMVFINIDLDYEENIEKISKVYR